MESEYLLLITETRTSYMWIRDKEDLCDEAVKRLKKRISKGSIVSFAIRNPRY